MQTNIHFWSYLAQFSLEWEMFQTKAVEKIKTHILSSVTFFRKSCRLWDNVENILYSRKAHRWQYGACALRAVYLRLQTHTQNMLKLLIYRFNNSRMLLSATLYVQCPSRWLTVSLSLQLHCCVRIRFVSWEIEFLWRWTQNTCCWSASQFDTTHFV